MKEKYILTREDIEKILYEYLYNRKWPNLSDLLKQYPKYYIEEDYTLLEE